MYLRSECEHLFPIESAENDLIDLTAQSNDRNQQVSVEGRRNQKGGWGHCMLK